MYDVSRISFRTAVFSTLGIIVVLVAGSLLIYQARYLIIGPQITITNAPTGPQNEQQITLRGNARNISRLWLNDRQIFTDPSGNFEEVLVLPYGESIITLRATDRYGRTALREQSIVYAPASFYQGS